MRQKDGILGGFFFDAAWECFLQKTNGATILPAKHRNKCFFVQMSVFFVCLSRILPQFQCLKQSNKVSYKWGYTLYSKWPSPTSKCIPIYNQFFVAHLETLPMFRPKVWASRFRRMAQVLTNLSESRGGSAILLQVLGNSQYQDRGLASETY